MDYESIKKILFHFDPETAHHIAESAFELASFFPFILNRLQEKFLVKDPMLSQELFGKTFCNPLGIAAGFDKNATMTKTLHALGFGYVEIGTVTPKPQSGNPKPRLFRYIKQEAIQNAMGFNNDGAEVIKARLQRITPASFPIGVNIGKNKTTPDEQALQDYRFLIKTFHSLSDYLVINISSPNTPGLRDLQNESFIKELFSMAKELTNTPVLLKIAPDMSEDQAVSLCSTAVDAGAAGVIATNTSIDYSLLRGAKDFGGVSGKVIKEKSFAIFKAVAKELFGKTVLISVGGIDSAEEAYRRIRHGATLLQIYTSFIYGGPGLVKSINEGLIEYLKKDGFTHISEAIGIDIR
ncbi:quinone-dependent dihydroorotate dehydrogenase [Nitratiruptor sp. SB155-2]|uniref:Dihydroorotate dehydrogenase (quinone) n=1 Tax=Nitratiruptor sp. (strain SB155-2) TaxID=387092 RepID=PYRD_NITSB|nr:quinone-dependent dihydroorotate dehydrogenase [Nitratiruptor sp. SB155-2]A6Q2V6.1 RecName: Full=Dihydroorotate dehydrogenase (quinone); AltName: Full=DHOdehase; Short=DHOD; Short=DHODase; AltName: Full=Dihydroorotate oxidase [Nitratiruptor sp. SB155-2]BAF69815.1 dihydroorotate dehydrogenase [Nitratiruptor sp. SB155-2]